MNRRACRRWIFAALLATLLPPGLARADGFALEPFGSVAVTAPGGAPRSVALFVSGDGGWNAGMIDMARRLADAGALVMGIDIRHYLASMRGDGTQCRSLAVDFERLAHVAQRRFALPAYLMPALVGYSSGASLVYAVLAQSPPGTFAGALSLGFGPDVEAPATLCRGRDLQYDVGRRGEYLLHPTNALREPWVVLQGLLDQVTSPAAAARFAAATPRAQYVPLPHVGHGFGHPRDWAPQFLDGYTRIAAAGAARPVSDALADLPVTEVPAAPGVAPAPGCSDCVAVLLSGDGGWSGLDQDLAAGFAARGIPVVGFNSLRYFWQPRTPAQTTADVQRVIAHALQRFGRARVLVVGYSFGADVLPFVVNRLPESFLSRLASVNLLGLSREAVFEVRVADWITGGRQRDDTLPVVEEILRMPALRTRCFWGDGEEDDPCPTLPRNRVVGERVGRGHHFSGDASALVERMLTTS